VRVDCQYSRIVLVTSVRVGRIIEPWIDLYTHTRSEMVLARVISRNVGLENVRCLDSATFLLPTISARLDN
jgi:hypothetical protein